MNKPNTSHHTWAKQALAEFLARCFSSAARTLEWDAAAIRQAGAKRK